LLAGPRDPAARCVRIRNVLSMVSALTVSREPCVAWMRTLSWSHDRTTTSPALLLSTSRVPLVTSTVWSDFGELSGPPGRAWIGACCGSIEGCACAVALNTSAAAALNSPNLGNRSIAI
jgi:hypothetical protein